jgi:hypothetical protein
MKYCLYVTIYKHGDYVNLGGHIQQIKHMAWEYILKQQNLYSSKIKSNNSTNYM